MVGDSVPPMVYQRRYWNEEFGGKSISKTFQYAYQCASSSTSFVTRNRTATYEMTTGRFASITGSRSL